MNLSDRQIENILKLKINQPIKDNNFKVLEFNGTANGALLTKLYNVNDLLNNYVRIIYMDFAYYTDGTIWMRENAQDNKVFTENSNSRYSMLRPQTRIPPEYMQRRVSTSNLKIFVDGNLLNIFSSQYYSVTNRIDLNILLTNQITKGIEISTETSFFNDMVGNTLLSPFVDIRMFVEILNDINPLQIEQTINDN